MSKIKVLENVIRQMLNPIQDIPLYLVIKSICGKGVLTYDNTGRASLIRAVRSAAAAMNADGIPSKRPNEVGNYVEPFVCEALRAEGFEADKPKCASGAVRSAGYPDLHAVFRDRDFYIECKTYSQGTVDSPMRSFYLSPSRDFKVTRSAFHLIAAFSMVHSPSGRFRTDGWKLLDARNLLCDVKYEFQSNNVRLYSKEGGVRLIHEETVRRSRTSRTHRHHRA
jgi:hypothetical protein